MTQNSFVCAYLSSRVPSRRSFGLEFFSAERLLRFAEWIERRRKPGIEIAIPRLFKPPSRAFVPVKTLSRGALAFEVGAIPSDCYPLPFPCLLFA